jgi:hypothetical protein
MRSAVDETRLVYWLVMCTAKKHSKMENVDVANRRY